LFVFSLLSLFPAITGDCYSRRSLPPRRAS
jgi:hypothetical protein